MNALEIKLKDLQDVFMNLLPFRRSSSVTVCSFICKTIILFLFIVPASRAYHSVDVNMTNNGVVSFVLPTETWRPSVSLPGIDKLYFGIRHGSGWLPQDVDLTLSCRIKFEPTEEGNGPPLYFNLTLVDSFFTNDVEMEIGVITYPVNINGSCNGIFKNRSKDAYNLNRTDFGYIGFWSGRSSSLFYNFNVTGNLDGIINCTIRANPDIVRFTGTPDEYVKGLTKYITLAIGCGEHATIRASSTSSRSDGVCGRVNNATSDNGQLKLCVNHNGQPLPLDFSTASPVFTTQERIAVIMSADNISSAGAGEYTTQLFLVVSPD